jgi:hypothetical protein
MVRTVARYWAGMNVTPYSLVEQDDGFSRRVRRGGRDPVGTRSVDYFLRLRILVGLACYATNCTFVAPARPRER